MKRSIKSAMVLGLVSLPLAAAPAATIVFEDTFGNGSVANSDSVTNYWQTYKSPYSSPSAVTEASGAITLFSGGSGSTAGTHQMSIQSKAVSADLNFFTGAGKTYSVTLGSSLTGYDHNTSAVNETTTNTFNFSIASSVTNAYTANDAFQITVRNNSGVNDDIRVAYKVNASNTTVNQYLTGTVPGYGYVNVAGRVTGYDLTLTATTWQLTVNHTGGLGVTTYSGTHAIAIGDWGTNGDSIVELESVRGGGSAGKSTTVTIDRLTVAEVPEPASMALMAIGGLLLMGRRR